MLQDSAGYIWFVSENGASKYDSYEFHNFSVNDGLTSNSTLKIYEDYKGRIWFLSYNLLISYLDKGNIYPYKYNHILEEHFPSSYFFDGIYVDHDENVYLTTFHGGIVKISPTGKFYSSPSYEHTDNSFYINKLDIDSVSLMAKGDEYNFSKEFLQIEAINSYLINKHHIDGWIFNYLPVSNDSILISHNREIFLLTNGNIIKIKAFEEAIIGLFLDKDSTIWVSLLNSGIQAYNDNSLTQIKHHLFKGLSISKLINDREGNYWFATTENGVFLVPSLDFELRNPPWSGKKNIIITIEVGRNEVFFSNSKKEVYSLKIDNNNTAYLKQLPITGEIIGTIHDILYTENDHLWIAGTENMIYSNDGKKIPNNIHTKRSFSYNFIKFPNGDIGLGFTKGYTRLDKKNDFNTQTKYCINHKFLNSCIINDSLIYIGSMDGLFILDEDSLIRAYPSRKELNTRIADIIAHPSGLWVGTFDHGIVIVGPDTILQVTMENGLSSNRIKSIIAQNDSTLWIGTNRGINKIICAGANVFDVSVYTIWEGLSSNEINDLAFWKNKVWAATDNGLISFDPGKIRTTQTTPRVYIENIEINNKDTVFSYTHPHLRSKENNISFSFIGISFRDPGNTLYNYKLQGLENKWVETYNTSVRYSGLTPGEYTFMVMGKSASGKWSSIQKYPFTIKAPLTQTTGFWIVMSLIIIFSVLLVFIMVLRFQRKTELRKRQVLTAEQRALRAQMNPHFIFNSINSIQDLILEKDQKNAIRYLSDFSDLMRNLLENSKSNFISLYDETETLKHYLELEKLRFEDEFDYELQIDPAIDLSAIEIPIMIVQPFVENAIWHGLVAKAGKGHLLISFKLQRNDLLQIIVKDDGIGRENAIKQSKKTANHKSTGIINTKHRIQLMNQMNLSRIKLTIIDLKDNENNAAGTEIQLEIEI
jgi:ligand-binding sensor domain-containing protein